MKKFFTGDKNIDSIILKNLNDGDIFNIRLTGKYGRELCNYEPFWYSRLEIRFPYFLPVKPENTKLKDYYIHLVKTIGGILKRLGFKNVKNINQNSLKDLSQEDKDRVLRWVSQKGHLEIVKYLVQNGVDVRTNYMALEWASEEGQLEVVKYLVQNGADIHINDDCPLRFASKEGHLEVVKYLVENGAYIHAGDNYSLYRSSEYGYLEIVKYLVEKGANVHTLNDCALVLANWGGHLEVVKYLKSLP